MQESVSIQSDEDTWQADKLKNGTNLLERFNSPTLTILIRTKGINTVVTQSGLTIWGHRKMSEAQLGTSSDVPKFIFAKNQEGSLN